MTNPKFRNFENFEILKFLIFHWLFLRFFRKLCDPKIFQKYFSSDSKNCFLRWNISKFVLKCAHWSPLSNEPKTIEIVRVVQKLSTKRCRGPLYHKDVSFEVPISFRDSRILVLFAPGSSALPGTLGQRRNGVALLSLALLVLSCTRPRSAGRSRCTSCSWWDSRTGNLQISIFPYFE